MSVFHDRKDLIGRRPPAVLNKDLADNTTPSGYEEELHRQRNVLGVIKKPEGNLQGADVQQLMVGKVGFLPEEQERSISLNHEDIKPPHIKEEQEDLWSSRGGEYPGGPEGADTTKLLPTAVSVKSEEDEEKPESSQFYAVYITQIEQGADEESPEGPEPARYSDPEKHSQPQVEIKTEESSEPETEVSEDYLKKARENESGLIPVKNEDVYQNTALFECNRKQDVCSVSDKNFYQTMEINTDTCSRGSAFENQFTERESLGKHMMVHIGAKQEDPESTQIKDEQEEIWISQPDTIYSPLIPVKSIYDRPWSLQVNQRQTHEIEMRADIEDCGGPEPARNSDPERHLQPGTGDFSEPETEDSDDWRETREHHGLKSVINTNHERQKTGDKSHGCTECGKTFKTKWGLIMHVRLHTGEKLLSCSVCERKFNKKDHLRSHMKVHTEEKPFSCSDCGKRFKHKCSLKPHIARHRCRKSYSRGVSDQQFSGFHQALPQNQTELRGEAESGADGKHIREPNLETYKHKPKMAIEVEIHSGEKPFGCSVCGTRFKQKGNLTAHMFIHTGEKPFSCSVCGKRFRLRGHLNTHVVIHTGEKSFSCSFCSKGFKHKQNLTAHMFIHTGEKPFSCSECGKTFRRRGHLNSHMVVHTGEKPFICAICSKTFKTEGSLKRHMVGHSCS